MKTNNTPTTPKHTPLPWSINGNRITAWGKDYHVAAISPEEENRQQWEIDAAYIVRAVNLHQKLIQRLNGLIATLESVRANYDKPENALNGSWYAFDHMISDEITKTKIAITKAEGRHK